MSFIIFYSIINMQYHRKEQLIIPFTVIFELILKNSAPLLTSLVIFYWNSQILGFWCIISECYHPKLTNKPRLVVRYIIIKFILVFNTGDKVHVLFFYPTISFLLPCSWSGLLNKNNDPAWRKNVERWRKRSKISFIFDS